MTNEETNRLVQLRTFVIEAYQTLDGRGEPASVVKQTDVAHTLESIIKSIDDLLKGYVGFE